MSDEYPHRLLAAGQLWKENSSAVRDGRTARISAVADNHVMYRYKGDGMRVCGAKDFASKHKLKESTP